MPIHDWTRVDFKVFEDFQHEWILRIRRSLNEDLLAPVDYALVRPSYFSNYGFGPDVVIYRSTAHDDCTQGHMNDPSNTVVMADRILAMIELISPAEKHDRSAFKKRAHRACVLIKEELHFLILDILPPAKRDPNGFHAAIWNDIAGTEFTLPPDKPLVLASYESALTVKAFVETVAVGDTLPPMPLFLKPGAHILIPLEETYNAAFSAVPLRWRRVLEEPKS